MGRRHFAPQACCALVGGRWAGVFARSSNSGLAFVEYQRGIWVVSRRCMTRADSGFSMMVISDAQFAAMLA